MKACVALNLYVSNLACMFTLLVCAFPHTAEEYFTVLETEAIAPNGDQCLSEADYFSPVLVGCLVDVKILCHTNDGVDCSELGGSVGDTCVVDVYYEYQLSNIGPSVMDVTRVERTRENAYAALMDLLDVTTLNPGQSTFIIEKETVDSCQEAEFRTDVLVQADPPSRVLCADETGYTFSTSTVSPVD
jgi:hypothetical protein